MSEKMPNNTRTQRLAEIENNIRDEAVDLPRAIETGFLDSHMREEAKRFDEKLVKYANETGDWMSLVEAGIDPYQALDNKIGRVHGAFDTNPLGGVRNEYGWLEAVDEYKRRQRAVERGEDPSDANSGFTNSERYAKWMTDKEIYNQP